MKRDMDLVRAILRRAEDMKEGESLDPNLGEWDPHVVVEHALLLRRAGFLDAGFSMGSPPGVEITGLTWAGHDLLDSIRDDSVWAAVKNRLASVGGTASIDVLKAIAVQTVKEQLGLGE